MRAKESVKVEVDHKQMAVKKCETLQKELGEHCDIVHFIEAGEVDFTFIMLKLLEEAAHARSWKVYRRPQCNMCRLRNSRVEYLSGYFVPGLVT